MEGPRTRSLKTELFLAVSLTLAGIVLLSALTVWGCWRFQKWLVPDTNYVMVNIGYQTPEGGRTEISSRFQVDSGEACPIPLLEETENGAPVAGKAGLGGLSFSVESVDYGIGWNGPRRKLAYIGAGAAMGVLPAVYSVLGFLLCALWFYRKKLAPAITVLDGAAQHISRQDLDFEVTCPLTNELGQLCRSFEKMRQALVENHRELWRMLEERKLIQASVAHDLRNPIAIIEGYAEYLRLALREDSLEPSRVREIAGNIGKAAKRLEQYTESVRAVNQLDEIEIHRKRVPAGQLLSELAADLTLLASDAGKTLQVTGETPSGTLLIDPSLLYRILENLFNNALRYAREKIELSFALEDGKLTVCLSDDGDGFPEEILKSKNRLLPTADENGHCGMGLTISRLLCQKHRGRLELANRQPHGAAATVILEV